MKQRKRHIYWYAFRHIGWYFIREHGKKHYVTRAAKIANRAVENF